jgi:hypothetical protein
MKKERRSERFPARNQEMRRGGKRGSRHEKKSGR